MKISPDTLLILKNYSSINQSLLFTQGSTLATISNQKNTLAEAKVAEDFPSNFAIFDLNEFLSVVSLFNDPTFEIEANHVRISEQNGKSNVRYYFADPSMIATPPPDKSRMLNALSSAEVKFLLTESDFQSLLKASSVLGVNELAVESDGNYSRLVVFDVKNKSSNDFAIDLDEANGTSFRLIFKVENLKLLKGSYEVAISSQLLAHFKNTDIDLDYYISLEENSEYGDK